MCLLIPLFAIFTAAACFVPGINMARFSLNSQQNALHKYIMAEESSALTQRQIDKAAGAYWYLREEPTGKAWLQSLPEEDKAKLENLKSGSPIEYEDFRHFYYSIKIPQLTFQVIIPVIPYRYRPETTPKISPPIRSSMEEAALPL